MSIPATNPALSNVFDREKHVYRNDAVEEMLKDSVRFFSGTPVFDIPPPENFSGAGIYALYYIGRTGLYKKFGESINRTAYAIPIYVGKAVPTGWRQNRNIGGGGTSKVLFSRLRQHAANIGEVRNLKTEDFKCRFMIFEGVAESMIAAVEAAVIAAHNPLWNSVLDGFGNHDPGKRRVSGRLSAWDALHPGRGWTDRITGEKPSVAELTRRITDYMVGLR